ncbi:MAG: hypothetical protein ACREND_00185 [Gemmatimonadaceae bacterium]
MRQFGLSLAVALLGVAGCSSSLGITSPRQIEADLVGEWFQSAAPEGGGTNFRLGVSDTTVTGTGRWFGEAIPGGDIVVAGVINGSEIKLELAEDNGTTLHFAGHMLNDNLISGAFVGSGAPVAVEYRRQDAAQLE